MQDTIKASMDGYRRSKKMSILLRTTALAGFVIITACTPSGNDTKSASNQTSQGSVQVETYERETKKQSPVALSSAPSSSVASHDIAVTPQPLVDRENYAHLEDNPVHLTLKDPVSTFSIDVDTGGVF